MTIIVYTHLNVNFRNNKSNTNCLKFHIEIAFIFLICFVYFQSSSTNVAHITHFNFKKIIILYKNFLFYTKLEFKNLRLMFYNILLIRLQYYMIVYVLNFQAFDFRPNFINLKTKIGNDWNFQQFPLIPKLIELIQLT